MLTNINFTDPQGATHTDAVFCIKYANYSQNSYERFDHGQPASAATTNTNLDYCACYWISQAAKDAGAAAYTLSDTNDMDMSFNFNPDSTYDALDLEGKAEKHLLDVVLAPMLNA